MISPVSFGSIYKVHSTNLSDPTNAKRYFDMLDYCDTFKIPTITDEITDRKGSSYDVPTYSIMTTITTEDNYDKTMETFFRNNGIQFKKFSTEALKDPKAISSRVADAPEGMKKVFVNPDRLFELLEHQKHNNIEHCERTYEKYFKEETKLMIRSGEKFPTTTLYISSNQTTNDFLDYVEKYGHENVNDNVLAIDFSQRTGAPDHCMYFALIDAELKEIPVYVNEDTYKIGKALELFN